MRDPLTNAVTSKHANTYMVFFKGLPETLWQLHHVSLNVSTKFRVVFKGTKGAGSSTGGLSLDDVNLSETTCPEHVWRIKNFKSIMENTPRGTAIYSPRFRSKYGYTFQMGLYPNGTETSEDMGAYASLTSGDDVIDGDLTWPCPWMQITMMLMDQNADIRKRMSNQRSFTSDPNQKVEGSHFVHIAAFITHLTMSAYFKTTGVFTIS